MSHKLVWLLSLAILLCAEVYFVRQLIFEEDITSFLPFSAQEKRAMDVYERSSGGDKIVVLFDGDTFENKCDAIDYFDSLISTQPSLKPFFQSRVDGKFLRETAQWFYNNIPYFLQPSDYARMDSILRIEGVVQKSLKRWKDKFQMPFTTFVDARCAYDPLCLFDSVLFSFFRFTPSKRGYTIENGYMMTADYRMAFAFLSSPYGMRETKENAKIVNLITSFCVQTQNHFPNVSVRLTGAPVIAVDNAQCIKKDTTLAIIIALLLIAGVLGLFFRKDGLAIVYILLTISFGWLFGMTAISLFFGKISLIVLGMGSVIIGIAINYPLHLVVHRHYAASVRNTLIEVVTPLTVGSITTIGAFLTLVPLQAVSLQQLGIFFSSTLVGTLLFTLFFLPPLIPNKLFAHNTPIQNNIARIESFSPSLRYFCLILILLATAFFYYIGHDIHFDTNLSHINYMSAEQQADVTYLSSIGGDVETDDIYVISSFNDNVPLNSLLLCDSVTDVYSPLQWLPNEEEQKRRLTQWNTFWQGRTFKLKEALTKHAKQIGFANNSFSPFTSLLDNDYQVQPFSYFSPITQSFLKNWWIEDDQGLNLISKVKVKKTLLSTIKNKLTERLQNKDVQIFNIQSLNSHLVSTLSANFDYIGIFCSALVFILLFISFKSLSLAFLAFLPMVVSWVWIIGLMRCFGLCFNVVNIILATFIFGQGDDYTVFVIEGMLYERRMGKPMLRMYRSGIYLSAIIMLIGMGVLVFVRHPAIRSLGTITLVGMTVVVCIANLLPTLIMSLLAKNKIVNNEENKHE